MVDINKFKGDVYSIVASIPYGKVTTYGQIAWLAGYPKHSRLVGHVLQSVPQELHLPCHRVVNSLGRPAPHWYDQINLLKDEGVKFLNNGRVDMKAYRWNLAEKKGDVEP